MQVRDGDEDKGRAAAVREELAGDRTDEDGRPRVAAERFDEEEGEREGRGEEARHHDRWERFLVAAAVGDSGQRWPA